jgi:3-oxoacyl-[acyl-carrier protein] reductase
MAKTAIITGAAGGIGRGVAKHLAADGFSVIVNHTGDSTKADEVVNDIKNAGGQATAIKADIADETEVASLFERALSSLGRIDAVVHCAGVLANFPIIKNDVKAFDKVIAVNLRGTFLVLAQAAQHVADGGRIIALSSSVIAKSTPTYGAYIASKAGIEGMVRVLANELRGRNITVNAVAPGPVATPFFLEGKSEELIAQMSKIAPIERLGEPIDVARTVSFLAGQDGGWINAQVIRPNGGFA